LLILTGTTANPLKTNGRGIWYSVRVDVFSSVGEDAEARGDRNMDLRLGGRLGNSSPRRKSPGLEARILK
jgi:hypothetical protein